MQNIKRIYFWRSKFDGIYSFVVNYLFGGNRIRRIVVENLRLKKGDVVLDVGCGSGRNFRYIIKKIGEDGKLIGVDNSKKMLNLAEDLIEKNNWLNNIELINRDVLKLTYQNKFDAIICAFGLTVMPKWKKALSNIINATKKDGKICIIDEVYTKDFFGFFNWFVWIDSKLAGADPKREIPKELEKLSNIKVKKFLFGTILTIIGNKE